MGAFERLFGQVRGELEQKFSKNPNARGLPGGMFNLQFDWYIILRVLYIKYAKYKDVKTEGES